MPRYENCGIDVDAWYATANSGSSNFDLCRTCGKAADGNDLPSKLSPYNPREPRGFLSEMEGPPDIEVLDYTCALCRVRLTDRNYYPR